MLNKLPTTLSAVQCRDFIFKNKDGYEQTGTITKETNEDMVERATNFVRWESDWYLTGIGK